MWNQPLSREPSPELRAIENESRPPSRPGLTIVEKDVLERVWRKMKWRKPHLYFVLRAYTDALDLRDSRTQYSHGLYRGFYTELANKLGIDQTTVRYRLRSAIKWFVRDVERWTT